jgi:hypothetical protein
MLRKHSNATNDSCNPRKVANLTGYAPKVKRKRKKKGHWKCRYALATGYSCVRKTKSGLLGLAVEESGSGWLYRMHLRLAWLGQGVAGCGYAEHVDCLGFLAERRGEERKKTRDSLGKQGGLDDFFSGAWRCGWAGRGGG